MGRSSGCAIFIVTILCCTATLLYAQSGWNTEASPSQYRLTSVAFANASTGVAVGDAGTILRTTNGGTTWILLPRAGSRKLMAVARASAQIMVAVGTSGTIQRSSDGGLTWNAVSSPTQNDIFGVAFATASTGYAVGHGFRLMRTTDAGMSWTSPDTGSSMDYRAVAAPDVNTIYISGGPLLRSRDGGIHWDTLIVSALVHAIHVIDPLRIYLASGNTGLGRTLDGGATWTWVEVEPNAWVEDVCMIDSLIGYAATTSGISRTTDGGATWRRYPPPDGQIVRNHSFLLTAITLADSEHLVAVGDQGAIVATAGNSTQWEPRRYAPLGALRGLAVFDTLRCIAVGDSGLIVRTDSAPGQWNYCGIGSIATLRGVAVGDANTAIAVGDSGEIQRSTDGGKGWNRVSANTRGSLHAIVSLGSQRWIAAGDSGAVLVSVDGGLNWQRAAATGTTHTINGLAVTAGLVLAVGDSGTLVRSTNRGDSWVPLAVQRTDRLTACIAIDATTYIVVGFGGLIMISTDAGASWTVAATQTMVNLHAIALTGPGQLFVTGDHGVLLRSTDRGHRWETWISPTSADIFSIAFPVVGTGFICDAIGRVYHTSTSGAYRYLFDQNPILCSDMVAVRFRDRMNGYVISDLGERVFTTDGGVHWVRGMTGGISGRLQIVSFVSDSALFASGSSGMFRSFDAGTTWQQIGTCAPNSITAWCFADLATGYAALSSNVFIHTGDGGTTWDTLPAFPSVIRSIVFRTPLEGWVVGDNGYLAHTVTGGTVWEHPPASTTARLSHIALMGDTVIAVGFSGTVVRSTRGGGGQQHAITVTGENLDDIVFLSSTVCIAVGSDGVIVRSSDAGETWTTRPSPRTSAVGWYHVGGIDSLTALVIGHAGAMVLTTDAGLTWLASGRATFKNLRDVQFIGHDTGYVVGAVGAIIKTVNAGERWTAQESGSFAYLRAAAFTSGTRGWVVGDSGTVLHTVDGGTTWTKQSSGTMQSLRGIATRDSLTAVLVGARGTVRYTTTAGASWLASDPQTTASLSAVAMLDARTVVAAGDQTVLRSTNAGVTWSATTSILPDTIVALVFQSPTTGEMFSKAHYCVDCGRANYWHDRYSAARSTDAGVTWTKFDAAVDAVRYDAAASDSLNIVAAGNNTIARSVDGGATWTKQDFPISDARNIYGIAMTEPDSVTVVGDLGSISRIRMGGPGYPRSLAASRWLMKIDTICTAGSGSDTLTLINAGDDTLHITSFSGDTMFRMIPGALSIPPHQTAVLTIVFSPDGYGEYQAKLPIQYFPGGATDTLNLSGIAGGARFHPPTSIWSFDLAGFPITSSAHMSFKNTGNVPLVISSITCNNPVFAIDMFRMTVPAGTDTEITVVYTPTKQGSDTAVVVFTSNSCTSPDTVRIIGTVTVGVDEQRRATPGVFSLAQNYPNPVVASTSGAIATWQYSVGRSSHVAITLTDMLGRKVRTLVDTRHEPGTYAATCDMRSLPHGVYLCTMTAGGFRATRTVVMP